MRRKFSFTRCYLFLVNICQLAIKRAFKNISLLKTSDPGELLRVVCTPHLSQCCAIPKASLTKFLATTTFTIYTINAFVDFSNSNCSTLSSYVETGIKLTQTESNGWSTMSLSLKAAKTTVRCYVTPSFKIYRKY